MPVNIQKEKAVLTFCMSLCVQKSSYYSKFKGGYSENCSATVVNLVTYDEVDDKKHISLVS
jgi:hypothetical protein